RGHAVLHDVALVEGFYQGAGVFLYVLDQLAQFVAVGELHVFFPEVEFKFDKRRKMDQRFPQVVDLLRKSSAHLVEGCQPRVVGFRVDEVGDGFRLREVETTVEKSPLCKFSWLRQTRAFAHKKLDDPAGDERGTVTGNLHGVFAGEGAGTAKDRHHRLVEGYAAIPDHPEMYGV